MRHRSRPGRTLASTISRKFSRRWRQTEDAPRRITGPAVANPRIRWRNGPAEADLVWKGGHPSE